MKVFIFRAVHTGRSAAVLTAIVVLFGVAAAHASISTKTMEALTSYPNGGPGLEAAITQILDEHTQHSQRTPPGWKARRVLSGKPHIVAREILGAAASASDEQMAAIGRALAAHARVLAQSDPGESRAIADVVRDAQNAALQKSFSPTPGGRMTGLDIPSSGDHGGFDAPSAN